MAVKRISAETLVELSLAVLREEIAPHLPADKRYAAAMLANALEIARREVASEAEPPLWALLDELYEPGESAARQLAGDIRSGTINEGKHPGLASKLLAMVEAELAIANPRFLAARKERGS